MLSLGNFVTPSKDIDEYLSFLNIPMDHLPYHKLHKYKHKPLSIVIGVTYITHLYLLLSVCDVHTFIFTKILANKNDILLNYHQFFICNLIFDFLLKIGQKRFSEYGDLSSPG